MALNPEVNWCTVLQAAKLARQPLVSERACPTSPKAAFPSSLSPALLSLNWGAELAGEKIEDFFFHLFQLSPCLGAVRSNTGGGIAAKRLL